MRSLCPLLLRPLLLRFSILDGACHDFCLGGASHPLLEGACATGTGACQTGAGACHTGAGGACHTGAGAAHWCTTGGACHAGCLVVGFGAHVGTCMRAASKGPGVYEYDGQCIPTLSMTVNHSAAVNSSHGSSIDQPMDHRSKHVHQQLGFPLTFLAHLATRAPLSVLMLMASAMACVNCVSASHSCMHSNSHIQASMDIDEACRS